MHRFLVHIPVMDAFSKDGADAIALRIAAYWRECGHSNVRARSYRLNESGADWGVRSNLVGGLPPKGNV